MIYWIIATIAGLGLTYWLAPKGWRTVAVNAAIAGAAAAGEFIEAVQVGLPDDWAVYGIIAVNIINLLLRKVTTTRMGHAS